VENRRCAGGLQGDERNVLRQFSISSLELPGQRSCAISVHSRILRRSSEPRALLSAGKDPRFEAHNRACGSRGVVRAGEGWTVEVCDICGAPFDLGGYYVIVGGERYDSVECALRATDRTRPRPADATSAWVAVARQRLGLDESSPNEREPAADP
jgi:hypothetical protein